MSMRTGIPPYVPFLGQYVYHYIKKEMWFVFHVYSCHASVCLNDRVVCGVFSKSVLCLERWLLVLPAGFYRFI